MELLRTRQRRITSSPVATCSAAHPCARPGREREQTRGRAASASGAAPHPSAAAERRVRAAEWERSGGRRRGRRGTRSGARSRVAHRGDVCELAVVKLHARPARLARRQRQPARGGKGAERVGRGCRRGLAGWRPHARACTGERGSAGTVPEVLSPPLTPWRPAGGSPQSAGRGSLGQKRRCSCRRAARLRCRFTNVM